MKKRIVPILGILLVIILITALICFNKKDGTMICTMQTEENEIKIKAKYQIEYKNKVVETIVTKEEITSEDEEILKNYKTLLENMYQEYNKIDYYMNKVEIKNDTLTSITKINYKKIDLEQLITIDSNNRSIIEDNQVSLKKLKQAYTQQGARCR